MSETVLDKIVAHRRADLAKLLEKYPRKSIQAELHPSERDFYQALTEAKAESRPSFILECKRASPSKGLIREDFDIKEIVQAYAPFATVISVLTEERHFGGDFENIALAKAESSQPILCKDFIVEAYQIELARYFGADAVLLMLSILRDDEYRYLKGVAESLGMGVLTEVNDEEEVRRALRLQAKVVGINNRDLRDLSVDLKKTERLRQLMPKEQLVISESGIRQYRDIRRLFKSADGFLIGSHLMGSKNLPRALTNLLCGSHKVCGLTRPEDALKAYEAGAVYGGLIFILTSERGVTYKLAQEIVKGAPLKFVGVFQNDDIETIKFIVREVGLSAVQLHGEEPQAFITALRKVLPKEVKIIKAVNMVQPNRLPKMDYSGVDHYLLDGPRGGSGIPFDWSILSGQDLSNTFLAGGIAQHNIQEALNYAPLGVDLNSGVEDSPGRKSAAKLDEIFQTITQYFQNQIITKE